MFNGAPHSAGVCFIIPPHMLDHLADYALTPETRNRAKQNLYLQGTLRGMRTGLAQFGYGGLPTGTLRRTVYAAQHRQDLPGKLVRSEGRRAGVDDMANEAYDHAGATYEFFLNVYNRNSLDGRGMRLDSTIHFAQGFDNAFWNGQQMVYGDGDGVLFDRFTKCLDVVGHELVHGITQFSARLEYHGQPGALNESMSDVFGSLVKQYALKQSAEEADWLIGAGLFLPKPGVNRAALRSLKAPGTAYEDPQLGKDPQPGHMRKYYRGAAITAACTSIRGFPTMPSTSQPWRWAAMPGRSPGASGTKR